MRLPDAVRMPDDASGPVWTRSKKRGGNPIVGFIGFVLGLVGLLTLVLAAVDGGFAKGGAQVDGWIGGVANMVSGAKSKAVAMDNSTPVEPASAPASSQPAATSSAPADASTPAAKH
jgi:hypothetical protein